LPRPKYGLPPVSIAVGYYPAVAHRLGAASQLTVNGLAKPVTLEVTIAPHNNPALKHSQGSRDFIATTRIRRSAFNMAA
jgi:polyisoprenoid-binding protein YceI